MISPFPILKIKNEYLGDIRFILDYSPTFPELSRAANCSSREACAWVICVSVSS